MPPYIDRVGQRFGRLVVIERIELMSPVRYRCQCDCGNDTTVQSASLVKGDTASCGCLQREAEQRNILMAHAAHRRQRQERYAAGDVAWQNTGFGYICAIWPEHPICQARGKKTIFQHWHVWGEAYSNIVAIRLLDAGCSLHHINGIRDDNRLENLELRWPGRHPKGWTTDAMIEALGMLGYTVT